VHTDFMNAPSSQVEFSVVIPNYNHATYLPAALDSVVSQSLQPLEICVIDDASTDNSVEIINAYARQHPRIHLIRKSENSGMLANCNEILGQLRGTHVIFLGADDYLLPNALAQACGLVSQHSHAGICLWDLLELGFDGGEKRFSYALADRPAYFSPALVAKKLRYVPIIGMGAYRLDCLRKMGGFPVDLRWHTDQFTVLVLALRHGICYLPEPLWAYRHLRESYGNRGMSGPEQIHVLRGFLSHLQSEEFADVREGFRDSGGLAIFGYRLLKELRTFPGGRYYLTPSLAGWLLRRKLRSYVRHPVPRPIKAWFRSTFNRKFRRATMKIG